MAITAQELRNLITGDDTSYQAAAKRTETSLAALQAQAARATAAISASFGGFAPSVNAASSSFANFGSTVTTSFDQAGVASQAASGVMSASLNGVQAAAAVVPASLTAIANESQIMAAAVATNGNGAAKALEPLNAAAVVASNGLNGLGVSAVQAGVGIGELATRKAQLVAELANVTTSIRSETSVLANAQTMVAGLGGSHTALNSVVKDSETKLAGYIAQQALLKGELGTVNAALKTAAVAQGATNVVQGAAGVVTEDLGKKTGILSSLMQGHTTQITSQGTVWKGYDNVLQAVIRTMGGIPILAALGITILGVLAEKMLHSKSAAQELKDVSDELIKSDLLLIDAFARLQEAAGSTTQSFAAQADTYRKLIAVDVGSVMVKFAESFKQSQEEIKKTEGALKGYQNAQADVNEIMRMANGSTIDYTDLLKLAQDGLNASAKTLNDETAARDKNEQEMHKATEALLVLYNSGQQTIPQLEEMARSALGAGQAFDRLQAELLKATSAQQQLNAAAANYRPPKLDSTLATYDQLRASVNNTVTDLERAGRTQGEILIAIKPQLEAVKKAVIDKAAAELTGANTSIKNAAAQKFLSEELKRGGDKTAEYAGKIPLLEKNIKALSSTTETHAKASGGARSAISQYAEGVIGLGKAFDIVTASLTSGRFGQLFDELPKKARAGLADLKQAAQTVVKELDDLLKHVTGTGTFRFIVDDKTLKPTIASLEAFGAAGVAQFRKVGEASSIVEAELTKLRLTALNLKTPIFEIPFTAMYDQMGRVTEAGKKMADAIEKAGGVIKLAFPAAGMSADLARESEALDANAKVVENWARLFVQSLDDVKLHVPSLHPALDALRLAVQRLKEDIASSPFFEELKMKDEASRAFESVIHILEREGERIGETQDQTNQRVLAGLTKFGSEMAAKYGLSAQEAIDAFKRQMDRLPGALDEIFNKLALGAKHQVAGLFQVIDSIPGKFGDAFRKSTSEITKWIDQIDGILKGLHKIFQGIPDGLAGMLQSIVGIFSSAHSAISSSVSKTQDEIQKTAKAASQGLESVSGALKQSGNEASQAASKWISAIMNVASAIAIFAGTRGQGKVAGVLGGAMAGLQIGAMFGPIGAGIGAGIGALVGLFGSGKSELQKAQEAAQLQQAKDAIKLSQQSVEQAFEQTKQSILETAGKARELLEAITFYTQVPKDAFKAFFSDLDKLMKAFAEHAKSWMTDASGKIKVFADDMKIITESIGGAVLALTALGPYPGVADKYITRFGDDLSLLIDKISVVGDAFTRKGLRTARKFAEQIGDVVSVVANAILAFAGTKDTPGLAQYQRVPLEVFDLFAADLQLAVQKMGEIAGQIDNGMLKQANFFAEKTQAVVDVIAGAMLAFLGGSNGPGLAQFATIPGEVIDAFFVAFLAVTNKMADLTNMIDTTVLAQAEMVAEKSLAIFKAIKDGVQAFTALGNYKSIAQESIDAILADFKRAIILLNLLLLDATEFESKAKTFDAIVMSGAAALTHGMSTFVGSFTDMAAKLLQLPQGGTSLTPGPGFGSVGGMSTQSLSPSMSTQSHTTYIQIGDLNIPADSTAGQLIKRLVEELAGIATGGMSRDPLLS